MKKRKSSGGNKLLIILSALTFLAIMAFGVVWSTQFIRQEATVAPTPAATHMKIPQAPPAKTMKIPAVPPRVKPPQEPVETVPPQADPSQTALENTSSPPLSQDSATPEPAVPLANIKQSDTPTDTADAEETISTPPVISSTDPAEVTATPNETDDSAPAAESHEPRVASNETPEDSAQTIPEDKERPAEAAHSGDERQSPPHQSSTETASIADDEKFNLQIGAYRMETYARDAMVKLSRKGYTPFILQISDARQRIWYTVRIGRFASRAEAAHMLDQFNQKENIDAVIAKAGKL